ncbi:alanine racemase [Marivibrio halodurans]|uniref:Alanine racemase n=1 Tax=Marivibrio halodurans TaxID=2039722 RepID=A0A8J7RWX3_9PROT|nr:alanine racemase [Marivibrio halodurans]MBP5855895.1 alanine racemase [Marivibrio halodurans]
MSALPDFSHSPTELIVDLDALADNWRLLRDRAAGGGAFATAVVKADGYGLGIERVGPALHAAGCRTFFTAHLDEAIALRALLPDADVEIGALNGLLGDEAPVYRAHRIMPTLNDLGQIERWAAFCQAVETPLPAGLHIDTGMCRLGLPWQEIDRLAAEPAHLDGFEMRYLMSHLVSADAPSAPINRQQADLFARQTARLPKPTAGRMLANSSGCFLGRDWLFECVRPGVAIYGVAPDTTRPNPMRPVVRLSAKILQIRDVDAPQTVGYGAAYPVARPSRVATVAVGYADGYLRTAGAGPIAEEAVAHIGQREVPVIGRISMDLTTLDVTDAPEATVGTAIDMLGPLNTVDRLASAAGTIGYEILTSLGRRHRRRYVGGDA